MARSEKRHLRLAPVFRKHLKAELTEEIQAWLIVVGFVGMVAAPFIPLTIAVIVINVISFVTLVTAGMAGLDSARNP